jgi:electron transfer flavoprotein alpha subunit
MIDKAHYSGVWVFAEQRNGAIQGVTFELLAKGRELAGKRGTKLAAVLFGHGLKAQCADLFAHGADVVYYADAPALATFNGDAYTAQLAALVQQHKPEILLGGSTIAGRSFFPRVAVRVDTGLASDCTALDVDAAGVLQAVRPAFAGNVLATIVCPEHRPQMATVRPTAFKKGTPAAGRTGELIEVPAAVGEVKTQILETVRDASNQVNISDADIIVAGGRGIGGPDQFGFIQDLAAELKGAVGASRAAVDAGWISSTHQVGQTGKTVKPKLYIACGISGAIQHLAGMGASDFIIAINKDAAAPIFDIADIGIVGDLFAIVPALTQALKRR